MASSSAQGTGADAGPNIAPTARTSVLNESFRRFAAQASVLVGSSWAFLLAITTILVWAVTGPLFQFSDTWQLIINTGTTIVTFLMVFLIQNTQNRDARAIHLKLDELLRAVSHARNELIDVEEMPDERLEQLKQGLHECRDRGDRSEAALLLRLRRRGFRRRRRAPTVECRQSRVTGSSSEVAELCARLDRLIQVLAVPDPPARRARRPGADPTKRGAAPHPAPAETNGVRLRSPRGKP
jgi:low affinity Fe/Cu permease